MLIANREQTLEERYLIISKRMGGGSLDSKSCFHYKKLLSNHYCLVEVRNSNIVAEGYDNKHICGRNSCIISRITWLNAEYFPQSLIRSQKIIVNVCVIFLLCAHNMGNFQCIIL